MSEFEYHRLQSLVHELRGQMMIARRKVVVYQGTPDESYYFGAHDAYNYAANILETFLRSLEPLK